MNIKLIIGMFVGHPREERPAECREIFLSSCIKVSEHGYNDINCQTCAYEELQTLIRRKALHGT
jgi:hypothetical protein